MKPQTRHDCYLVTSAVLIIVSCACVIYGAFLVDRAVGFIVLGLCTFFFAYIVHEIMIDNRREAQRQAPAGEHTAPKNPWRGTHRETD